MIPPIAGAVGPLGASEWSIQPISSASVNATGAANTGGGFGGILSNAIDTLEQTQAAGTTAAQQLATGTLADPTKAITAVENASLEMEFAAQLRTKLDDVATNLFQTQA